MTANGYTGTTPGSGGSGAVDSVNGRTGAVVLTKTDVSLASVDNTSDASKPVSTAQATALALKANIASPTFTGTVSGITSTMVGLGSVDNTSDASKPVSTAQQVALNLKANIASPTFTGTVAGVTASMVGLGNVTNTSDANKPVSTAQQTALDLKADLASPALTGNPTAPTQSAGNNTTRLATTAFVTTAVSGVGGGSSPVFVRSVVNAGDITPGVDAGWTLLTAGLGSWTIPAVVGDEVEAIVGGMIQDNASSFYELVSTASGSIVRFGSTGTSSPAGAGEGDPVLYPKSSFSGFTVTMGFTVVSGDLTAGNVTFTMAHLGASAGKLFASTNYPLRYRLVNFG